MGELPRPDYRFSGFRVDPLRRILYGADGEPIPLKPKVFDTLLYLVEHPHELLDRRHLLKAIWPNVVVDENNLNQAVSALRRVLGEHPEDHRYILTEPGRGYRFVATISRGDDESRPVEHAQPGAPSRDPEAARAGEFNSSATGHARGTGGARWKIYAVAAIVIAFVVVGALMSGGKRDLRSVAALPFEDLSTDGENALFVRALHDDILTQLAKIQALKVISRTSVTQYHGSTKTPREIGEELGTASVLEGTVQWTSDVVHLNVRLVDVQTGKLLWSGSYDREPTVQNLFAIQIETAKSIAGILKATLTDTELDRLSVQPTQNTSAYEYYVSGREYARGRDLLRDLPAAVQQFERAVAEDPLFALAFAHLAIENIHMYWTMDHNEPRREKALAAVRRALELQPDLPDAHLAMGWYHYHGHLDYEAALAELAIAEQGMPGDADVLFARSAIYQRMGQLRQALSISEQAVEIDPRNVNLLRQHASIHTRLREYAKAEQYLDKVLEIAPDAVEARVARANIAMLRDGDAAPLFRAIDGNPLLRPGEEVLDKWFIAIRERDYEEAVRILGTWEPQLIQEARTLYKSKPLAYGIAYRLAGQSELAREQFEIARAQIETALALKPDEPRLLIALGEAMVGLGETGAGIASALRALELMPTSVAATDGAVYRIDAITRVLAPAGAADLAVQQLDGYLSEPGFWSIEGLLPDPRLDPIRDDPGFNALVEKYRRDPAVRGR
jgi:TolB-like protein/DNA-binding winged helix-turn-helix (wHTH) protein/Flp pilus assembly protein TadD